MAVRKWRMRLPPGSPIALQHALDLNLRTSGPAAAKIAAESPGDLNNVFFTTGGYRRGYGRCGLHISTITYAVTARKEAHHCPAKGYHGSAFMAASVSGKELDKSFLDTDTNVMHFVGNVNPISGLSINWYSMVRRKNKPNWRQRFSR